MKKNVGIRYKRPRKKAKVNGEPVTYKEVQPKNGHIGIRQIRGIYKAWLRAPKYILRLDADLDRRMYLGTKNNLVTKSDEARKFALGFDDSTEKVKYWGGKIKVAFMMERIS